MFGLFKKKETQQPPVEVKFDHNNPAHYVRVGCPKCGAKHRSFPNRPLEADKFLECYRCWHMFNTSDARMYLNDVRPEFQASCQEQFSGMSHDDFNFPTDDSMRI